MSADEQAAPTAGERKGAPDPTDPTDPRVPSFQRVSHIDFNSDLPATPPADDASEGLSRTERGDLRDAATLSWEHLYAVAERIVAARESAAATRARAEVESLRSQLGQQADVEREAFGRGVAWSMGDDDEAPFARARAEGAAGALRDAADEMEAVIAEGDMAEVAAPVPGEVGRSAVVARRDALYEEPHTWLRDHAASLARSDAAPHTGAQSVDWDSPTWGGGVHHATTDDLGDHGRHADETEQ